MFKRILSIGAVLVLVTAAAAHADTIYTLTADACSGTCGTAPFGTVTLSQTDSKTVTVTETLASGEHYALTGAGDALLFNVSGAGTITVADLTTGFTAGGPDSGSAFGNFLDSIVCSSCSNGGKPSNSSGPLSFTVTSSSGVTLSDFIVSTPKGNGSGDSVYFASDILGANGNTGNVGAPTGDPGPPPPAVPEPASLLLIGTGALAAAGAIRRRIITPATRS